jgi:hypothetical protein
VRKTVKAVSLIGDLTKRIAVLAKRGGGTLELGDGTYAIDRPLRLPASVSLCMTPHAIIRALPGFKGEAIVVKDAGKDGIHKPCGWIRGGVIDGGRQPLTGLKIVYASRLEISELEVRDATYKGIHAARGWYEVNLSHVRCNVDLNTHYAPGSIGIHYEKCGDSLVQGATVIGYETGVRSDTWANDFSQVHVWNFDPRQGPMRYCFYANGIYDTYNQCYADSPTLAGFYVTKPFNRVTACRIYYSRWAKHNAGAGIVIGPQGEYGTFLANNFFGDKNHRLAGKYAGHLATACILGDSVSLAPLPKRPAAADGRAGDVVWVENKREAALYTKALKGWQRAKLKK